MHESVYDGFMQSKAIVFVLVHLLAHCSMFSYFNWGGVVCRLTYVRLKVIIFLGVCPVTDLSCVLMP